MKVRRNDSIVFFAIGITFCAIIAFFKESIFPEKYFFDSLTLQYAIEHPVRERLDPSFSNTAKFYRIFHIDKYVVAPLLALIAYFFVIFKLFKNYSIKGISFFAYILIIMYSAIAMVYLATFSKDLLLFLIIVVPFVYFEKRFLIFWSFFVIVYAYFFRNYWFITIALFWFMKLFIINKPKRLIFFIPLFYLAVNFVYNYVFGVPISMIREIANIDRDLDSGQTVIKTFIQGDNVLAITLNNIVTLLFLVIPIPLLLLGRPFYVILTFIITIFFYNFLKFYFKEHKLKEYENVFSFVISFMIVQSLFEPDYGSFVRHLSPLYPFIFLCIAKNTKWKQNI